MPESIVTDRESLRSAIHAEYFIGDSTHFRYNQLFKRFAESEYGKHMAEEQMPRFHNSFPYEPSQMLDDLGPSVHRVNHMKDLHDNTTVPMLYAQLDSRMVRPFSRNETVALRLASLLHDIGECTHPDIIRGVGFTVDDIPATLNDDEKRVQESEIRKYLYGKLYRDLPDKYLLSIEPIIQGRPIQLAPVEAFRAVEDLDYIKTAQIAGPLALSLLAEENSSKRELDRPVQLSELTQKVIQRSLPEIQVAADKYPYIGHYLFQHESALKSLVRSLGSVAA